MVEKDVPPLLLTEGAGGFLPGVPVGCCLGMASQRRSSRRRSESRQLGGGRLPLKSNWPQRNPEVS
jgi:hypothetical protein